MIINFSLYLIIYPASNVIGPKDILAIREQMERTIANMPITQWGGFDRFIITGERPYFFAGDNLIKMLEEAQYGFLHNKV